MANAYFYSNIASPATLSGNINNSIGSCTVSTTAGWPGSTPYVVAIDYGAANEELVKVTNNASGTLTIVRAFGGTSAVAHSSGAAVRHVYNAQDATDFRTHEAATAAVHGIAGSFVGTTDLQTLTNKTLTAPTINAGVLAGGGSLAGTFTGTPTLSGAVVLSGTPSISNGAVLAGTFTGTPTFSGNLTFSGAPTFSGNPIFTGNQQSNQTAAGNVVEAALVSGDTFDRWRVYADGKQEWGPGTAARDTTLQRSAAKILQTTNTFNISPTDTALDGLAVNLPTATAGDLLNLRVNSLVQAAMDSSGQFRIYGGNSPTTYTPTWGNTGGATFSTNTGYYWRLGKIVFVVAHMVASGAGSGSGIVTVTMPTSVERSTRQVLTVHGETVGVSGSASKTIRGGEVVFFSGGSGAASDRIRWDDSDGDGENNCTGQDIIINSIITVQGWYREA